MAAGCNCKSRDVQTWTPQILLKLVLQWVPSSVGSLLPISHCVSFWVFLWQHGLFCRSLGLLSPVCLVSGLWSSTGLVRCTHTSVRALPASGMSGAPEAPLSSAVSISSVAVGSTSCSVSHSHGCVVDAAIARGLWGASVCKGVLPHMAFPFLAYGMGPGCGKSCVDEAVSRKCIPSANIPYSWAFPSPGS